VHQNDSPLRLDEVLTVRESANDIAICVSNLGKCYQIYDAPRDRLKQFIVPRLQRLVGQTPQQYFREFWALKDVSFEVKKGETVGIIGRNGSGKSTLLQLICGTLTPSTGWGETTGRVAALLELGSGFNPEFTGRENVYMNGSILGLTRDEIDARFGSIAEFADIGAFIEQPVKTYSSGMLVRLAFAVSVCVDPDVLVVDEALAVGDMNFQAKCMTALSRIKEKGTTILFVSHDTGAVKSLCSRGIYLEHGMVKAIGKGPDVAELYIRNMREEMNEDYKKFVRVTGTFPTATDDNTVTDGLESDTEFKTSEAFDARVAIFRYGSGIAKISYVEMLDEQWNEIDDINFDQEIRIRIYIISHSNAVISPNYYIMDDKKNMIFGAGPRLLNAPHIKAMAGDRFIVTYTTRIPLREGIYSIHVELTEPVILNQAAKFLDVIDDVIVFRVNYREVCRLWAKVFIPNRIEIKSV
jgi:lipopolysaccharide transport system ATP-binding protein